MKHRVIAFLLALSLFVSISIPRKSNAQIVETAIVGSIIVGFDGLIDDVTDKAQNTGDYLLFKAATELKSLLDSWEEANSNLIDKAFNELNDSQRTFFAELDVATKKINGSIAEQVEGATLITELANQTTNDLNIFDNKLAVFRYSPRVVYPGMAQDIRLKIRGINFDRAEPNLILPNGNKAKRESLLKQEAVFAIPASMFQYDRDKTTVAKLKLEYLDLGKRNLLDAIRRKRNKASTDLAIMQLPQNLASYIITTKATKIDKEYWSGSREFALSGRNESRTFTQNPHGNGWEIDTESIKRTKSWGEAGKECSLNYKKPNGFAIKIRTGVITKPLNPAGPGYQHCIWEWKEFKEVSVTENKSSNGDITWNEDVPLNLPSNLESYRLVVNSFEGKKKVITTSEIHPFYEIKQGKESLIIRPRIPNDLNTFQ